MSSALTDVICIIPSIPESFVVSPSMCGRGLNIRGHLIRIVLHPFIFSGTFMNEI